MTVEDAPNGQTEVDSDVGEIVTFNTPSNGLTINTGNTGDDIIHFNSIGGTPPPNINVDGGTGTDVLNVDAQNNCAVDNGSSVTIDGLYTINYSNFETVNVLNAAETTVTLDGSGNLTIDDVNGGTSNDNLTISVDGTNLRINDPNLCLLGTGTGVVQVDGNTVDVPLANITGDITVTTQGGNDEVTIGDVVNKTGVDVSITTDEFDAEGDTDWDLQSFTVIASKSIFFDDGADLSTTSGNIDLQANTGGVVTGGFHGIELNGTTTLATTGGDILLQAQSGTLANNAGVRLGAAGSSLSTTGTGQISITGTSNGSSDGDGISILQNFPDMNIQTVNGNITLDGTSNGIGGESVQLGNNVLESTGSGIINLIASGVGSDLGELTILGTIGAAAGTGGINMTANTLNFFSNPTVQGSGALNIKQLTNNTSIGLGGGTGTLNLDDTEIGNLSNGFSSITIGDANSGNMEVNSATFLDPLTLVSGGNITDDNEAGTDVTADGCTMTGTVVPGASPGVLSVSGGYVLSSTSTLNIEIEGTDGAGAAMGHDQVDVTGTVDITGATLSVSGGHTPVAGQSFVIVDNDLADAVTGTFTGLAELAVAATLGGVDLLISYVGGDGNDVVLFAPTCSPIETTVALDGSGNLTIDDVNGGTSDDDLTIEVNGANLRISDASLCLFGSGAGVVQVNATTVDVPLANITGDITVTTQTGNDLVSIGDNAVSLEIDGMLDISSRNIIFEEDFVLTSSSTDPLVSGLTAIASRKITGEPGASITLPFITMKANEAATFTDNDRAIIFSDKTGAKLRLEATSADGIDLTGVSGTGNSFLGIVMEDTDVIASHPDGTITMTGTAVGGVFSDAIRIASNNHSTITQSINGDITLNGVGSGNGDGIFLNGAVIEATGSGNINLTGTSPISGILNLTNASTIGNAAGTGDINITTDRFGYATAGSVIQGTGSLTIKQSTNATTTGLGGGTGTLNLTDTELGFLADGFSGITIGDANAGDIEVNTATFLDPLTLVSGGNITDNNNAGTDITADGCTVTGTHVPGASPGVFVVSGGYTLSSSSTLNIEIEGTDGPGMASGHDQVDVTGTVDITGATLNVTGGHTPAAGESFIIINNDGSDAVTGTFNGLAQFATVTLNTVDMLISYSGGDGNDVVLFPCPAGSVVFVDTDASGNNNGSSWTDAFNDLQDALALVASGSCPSLNEIWVAEGTYYPDQAGGVDSDDRGDSFVMLNSVGIYGGFATGLETMRSQRDFVNNVTTLSGDIDQNDGADFANDDNNSYHVIDNDNNGLTSSAVLDGFTITAGNADGTGEEGTGAGMFNENSSPDIINCVFLSNNCEDNVSSGGTVGGAGIYNINASPNITACAFIGNRLDDLTNVSINDGGAGLYNRNSSPTITNCQFRGNLSDSFAAGAYNRTGTPEYINCSFSGNIGDAMGNISSSTPLVKNSIFWGNDVDINDNGGTATVEYCIVEGGHAGGTNILDVDPLFVTQPPIALGTTGDLHLQPCSPAINAGTAAGAPATDFDGDARPLLGGFDMGFDESTANCEIEVTKELTGVPTAAASGILGNYDAAFSFTICNTGTATLSAIDLLDDFDAQIGTAFEGIIAGPTAPTGTATTLGGVNGGYTGISPNHNLLDGTAVIAATECLTTTMTVEIDASDLAAAASNQATAEGTNSGTTISDLSDDRSDLNSAGGNDNESGGDDDVTLYPNLPEISVVKELSSTQTLGNGDEELTFDFIVENMGNTHLDELTLTDPLSFLPAANPIDQNITVTVTNITASNQPSENVSYNGIGDTDLLEGTDGLMKPGDQYGVTMTVEVDPVAFNGLGSVTNQATAGGTPVDNGGTPVNDPTTGAPYAAPTTDTSDSGDDPATTNLGAPGDTGGSDDPTPVSFFTCPTVATLAASPNPVCESDMFDLTASGLADMASGDNGETDFGIEFVHFASATADPYTGGTSLGTVTFANLTMSNTEAILSNQTLSNGTYHIYAILDPAPTSGSCRPSATTMLTVNEEVTTSMTGTDQDQCADGDFTMAANTPTVGTGAWTEVTATGVTITTATDPATTVTGLAAGSTATLRWTVTNGACSDPDDVDITNDEAVTAAAAGTDQDQCADGDFTMAANTPTTGTGLWTEVTATGVTITTATDPATTVTGLAAGSTATLRWTVTNGACSDPDDVDITNDEAVTAAAAGTDQDQCNDGDFTMAANTPTTGTGLWTEVTATGVTITTATDPATTVTGLAAGSTATLRWTVTNGACSDPDDVDITNDEAVTAAAAGTDQDQCADGDFTMGANTPTTGTGAWTEVTATGVTITTATDPATTVTGLAAGSTATLRWTVTNGACSDPDDVDITNDEAVTAAAAGTDQDQCADGDFTMGANTPTTGTGAWTEVTATGVTITTATDPATTVTGLAAGSTATLRWTVTNGACSDPDDVDITNDEAVTAAAAGTDQDQCNDGDFTMAANTPTTGTGLWTEVTATGVTITTATDPATTVTGLAAGSTATLRWTVTNGACSDPDDVDITNDEAVTAAAAGTDQDQCADGDFTMAANTPTVGTGAWTEVTATGVTITTATDPATTVTGLAAGSTATLRWTVTNGACSDFDDVDITNDEQVTAADVGTDQVNCDGGSFTMAANSPSTGTGMWSKISGTATITDPSSNTTTITGVPDNSAVTLRWTITNGACSDFDDVQLTIDNNDPTAMTQVPSTYNVNASCQVSVSASDIDNGSTDDCSFVLGISTTGSAGDGGTFASPTTSVTLVEGTDFDFTVACPANDDVYLHVIDENGNETVSSAVQVTIDDGTDPTVSTQVPSTYSVDADCEVTVSTTDIDDGSSDNCNFVLGISTTGSAGAGGTFAVPVTSVDLVEGTDFDFTTACPANDDVYLHVIDECGNETISSAVQVTVDDDTDPTVSTQVPSTYSVDGDCEVTVSTTDIDDGSSDNCSFVLGISTTGSAGDGGTFAVPVTSVDLVEGTDFDFTTACPANDDVYLHVVDECGNETISSAVQVTVDDDTDPTVSTQVPSTYSVDGDCEVTVSTTDIDDGSSDNCSFVLGISTTGSAGDGGTFAVPVTSVDLVEGTDFDFTTACPANDDVYLHVVDECGNETISSAVQVTIDDDTDPTVSTQVPATYSVDADCEVTVSTTDIDDGSSDNCSFVLGISTTGSAGDGGDLCGARDER